MLDIRLIRERTDFVKAELDKVGFAAAGIDAVLAADARRRALIQEVETLRAKRAEVSRTIGKQDPAARQQLVADMRAVGDRIGALEQDLAQAEAEFERVMLEVPEPPGSQRPRRRRRQRQHGAAQRRARRASSASPRGRIGSSARISASSTSSAA